MYTKRRSSLRAGCAALVLVLGTFAANALADPPDRVARIGFMSGSVSFQPAGADQWAEASVNRPLGTGDKVYTDQDSRVELEVGAANIRLDGGSTFDLLNLDDDAAQLELTAGVMNLHVNRIESGQSYEIDTPTLAFVVDQPGDYRIDIAPEGGSTLLSVSAGSGNVYGENNASYSVRSGSAYRFNDTALKDYEELDLAQPDDFDRWVSTRNARYDSSVSRTYVSEDAIGVADLDDNGSWNDEPEYGHVWYPSRVEADWAPYRSGHWSWIDPWGWTWVDNAAWGFTPFHYGRWTYVRNRWGWCPGRHEARSIYAPALVAFVGGSGWGANISVGVGGGPVGWFPLGPRDVYVPWYQASRGYFTNINVRNSRVINNVSITNVYNNYSRGGAITNVNYAYRNNLAAVTAVPREAFVGARPIAAARVRVDATHLRNAQVVSRIGIAPVQASFLTANAGRSRAAPPAAAFQRQVIARTAPPPRPAPIAARLQAIQHNDARPLQQAQLRQIAATHAATPAGRALPAQRVQVVGRNAPAPRPLPARSAAAATPHGATPNGRVAPAARAPANAAQAAGQRAVQPAARTPADRQALPSSRFAPGRGNRAAPPTERANPATRTPAPKPATSPRAAPMPAERATTQERVNGRSAAPARNVPSERAAPRNNARPPAAPRVTPQQPATSQQRVSPAVQRGANPRAVPRAERSAPTSSPRTSNAVQQRAAPAQRELRQAPVQRAPQPMRVEPRAMPQPQPRAEPQPRAMPQQRAQPQQRTAPQPQPQQRAQSPQQRAQPTQRQAPPRRDEKKDKDKDKDGNR